MPFFERKRKTKKTTVRKRSLVSACVQCGRVPSSKDNGNIPIIVRDKRCIPVSGKGGKKILLVRDQPNSYISANNDWFAKQKGKPSFIFTALHNADIDVYDDCWMTGAALCYGKGPSLLAIESCLPNLDRTIRELQPKLIIPIGNDATYAVMSFLWREDSTGDIQCFIGQQIPAKRWNAWVCPVYDSAYILSLGYRNQEESGIPTGTGVVAYLWLERYISAAVEKLEEEPFPDKEQKDPIQFLYSVDAVGELLAAIGHFDKGYAIFDYETNCLKPEVEGARVLCASVCLGGWNKACKVIVFPMLNDIVPEWIKFLRSPIPKVAHNCKFEDRWSNVYFKTPVNKWVGDTMLNAHILNCRSGITGLKFQAAVNFGVVGYADATKPYMTSGVDKLNRLHEVPLELLLKYCAQDSLFTWRLFVKQMRQFGEKPYWV
jgi:uracil-DNA glycosylase